MKTNFFSFAAVATVAIISLVFNTTTLQAQDTDWTQTPEYQQMYNDLMGTVNKTYEDTYNEGMNSANKIMEQQKADDAHVDQVPDQAVDEGGPVGTRPVEDGPGQPAAERHAQQRGHEHRAHARAGLHG